MPTVEELRDQAKELGVEGYSQMRKAELESAVAEAEAKASAEAPEEDEGAEDVPAEADAAAGERSEDEDEKDDADDADVQGEADDDAQTESIEEGPVRAEAESEEGGAATFRLEDEEGNEYAGPASAEAGVTTDDGEEMSPHEQAEFDARLEEMASKPFLSAEDYHLGIQGALSPVETDEKEEEEPSEEIQGSVSAFDFQALSVLAEEDKSPEAALKEREEEDDEPSDADVQVIHQGRIGEHTQNVVLESSREGEYVEAKEEAREAASDADSAQEAAEAVKEVYEDRDMTEAEAQDAARRGLETISNPRDEASQKLLKQQIEDAEGGETIPEGLRKPENVFETREEKDEASVEPEHAADAGHEVPKDPAGDEEVAEAGERLEEQEKAGE